MQFSRSSGLLLHPTCLPSPFGIGDLGPNAFRFIDFLADAEQSLWQILPFGPTGYGDSPYQCLSAFAGNPLLISPEKLVVDDLLQAVDLSQAAAVFKQPEFPQNRVNFGAVIKSKESLLRKAFDKFKSKPVRSLQSEYESFLESERLWLGSYGLFRALKEKFNGVAWSEWPEPLRMHDSSSINAARSELADMIEQHKFWQFLFFKQWSDVRRYCREKQIKIISDLPIFVAYDSVDVWENRRMFKLTDEGDPLVVAGVPPDYFSATGQLWGNPVYDWDRQRLSKFSWWIDRIQKLLEISDLIRIDHFRGFCGTFEIPFGEKTAEHGRFVNVPGRDIFKRLKEVFGNLPIIAEDLGLITPDVVALRDEFGLPGMRILQMAFRDQCNPDLPHNHIKNCVVYTATHDHDTTRGWFDTTHGADVSTRNQAEIEANKKYCLAYLHTDGREIHWDFIRAALASVGDACIIPLQDVLGLGSEARMNKPAVPEGNWTWRFSIEQLTPDLARRLKNLTKIYCRGKFFPKKSDYGY